MLTLVDVNDFAPQRRVHRYPLINSVFDGVACSGTRSMQTSDDQRCHGGMKL